MDVVQHYAMIVLPSPVWRSRAGQMETECIKSLEDPAGLGKLYFQFSVKLDVQTGSDLISRPVLGP